MKPDKMPDGSWRYGDAGDRFPGKPGDVWYAGEHILACADLERGAVDEFLERFCPSGPDCVYTDPPYNNSQATSFRTKAGVERRVDFDAFLDDLVRVVSRAKGFVWIETTFQQAPRLQLREALARALPCKLRRFEITYYRKYSAILFAVKFGESTFAELDDKKFDILEGMETTTRRARR